MVLNESEILAFGPVVIELEQMLEIFDEITWIGFKHEKSNASLIPVKKDKIKIIALNKVGGKSIFDKLSIIANYPKMGIIILKEIKKHKYIHSRAPSNPAVIAMIFSYLFPNKMFWFKYAGTWVDKASSFYQFQRKLLKQLLINSIVTINGDYSNKKNILAFENPCLSMLDRIEGRKIIDNKINKTKKNYCFVGALSEDKGVDKILEAFIDIKSDLIGTVHLVGDGEERLHFEKMTKQVPQNIIFHGFLSKEKISTIYEKSDFLILASKSEGFPKVIGEAMNFGCIPIVSNISCISQYVIDSKNGYLIDPKSKSDLENKIYASIKLNKIEYNNWVEYNYNFAEKFTYSYYKKRIVRDIFTF